MQGDDARQCRYRGKKTGNIVITAFHLELEGLLVVEIMCYRSTQTNKVDRETVVERTAADIVNQGRYLGSRREPLHKPCQLRFETVEIFAHLGQLDGLNDPMPIVSQQLLLLGLVLAPLGELGHGQVPADADESQGQHQQAANPL